MSSSGSLTVDDIQDAQLVRYNAVAALTCLLWDSIICLSDEMRFVWSQPVRSPTKWVHLFTRYFGLLAQTRLAYLYLTLTLDNLTVATCQELYVTQVVGGGVLMACTQAILMLRVYALCTQDRRIAMAMIALLAAELAAMPGTIHLSLPEDLGRMCIKPISVREIALFGVSAVIPQFMVVGLTIMRYISGRKAGWGRIPIVCYLIRDDIILVTIIVIAVVIASILTSVDDAYGYTGYAWLLTIIPSVSCRTILNFQKLAVHSMDENGTYDRRRRRTHPPFTHFNNSTSSNDSSSPTLTSIMLDSISFQLPTTFSQSQGSVLSRTPTTASDIQSVWRDIHSTITAPKKLIMHDSARLESVAQR